MVVFAPSLICGDLGRPVDTALTVQALGFDLLHVDIIDGRFAPKMPLGLGAVERIREECDLALEIHLMTVEPDVLLAAVLRLAPRRVFLHVETTPDPERALERVRDAGAEAGIAVDPATDLSGVEALLPAIDAVLVMQVVAGTADLPDTVAADGAESRVRRLADLREKHSWAYRIGVDGRVSEAQVPGLVAAGADLLVAGTACLFEDGAPSARRAAELHRLAGAAGVR